jgi:hypothetical protein
MTDPLIRAEDSQGSWLKPFLAEAQAEMLRNVMVSYN